MTNEDLLRQLIAAQKKALLYSRIALILAVLLIAGVVGGVAYEWPTLRSAWSTFQKIDAMSRSVNELVGDSDISVSETLEKLNALDYERLNEAMVKLDSIDLGQLNDAISRLNNVDFNRLNSAMSSLDKVDFDRLNEAIKELDDLMEPLNRFVKAMNAFG